MIRGALVLLVACAAALLGGAGVASAQRAAPSVRTVATFDPPSAAIGDRVTLTVQLTHPGDTVIKVATPNIEHLEVINVAPPTIVVGADGSHTTTHQYTMQPFLLGTIETGTLRLSWLRSDGGTGTLDAPGATMIVVPVRASNDSELRPLKPQASVVGAPPAWIRPTIIATAVLVIAVLLAFVTSKILARRGIAGVEEPRTSDTSPETTARRALDALGTPEPAARVDYPAYYGGLALTVRTYLAARFGFNAHALTTRELEARMVSHGVDRWQARLVGGLLERCDDAVYARRYPDPASADHDLTVAYEIVELSRPRTLPGDLDGRAALA